MMKLMKLLKIKRLSNEQLELGQWYWEFNWVRGTYEFRDPAWRKIEIVFIKPTAWGGPGERWAYRGVWLSVFYWLPFLFKRGS